MASAKHSVSNYWDIEVKAAKRYPDDPDCDDYQVDFYQLDGDKKRTDTFHPIEDLVRIADALNVSIYVTIVEQGPDNFIKVHLF